MKRKRKKENYNTAECFKCKVITWQDEIRYNKNKHKRKWCCDCISKYGTKKTWHHTKEAKIKISRANKGRIVNVGKSNGRWLGDSATKNAGRMRARKLFKLKRCVECSAKAKHIHHKDGNPLNNAKRNIQQLCVKCHTSKHYKFRRTRKCSDTGRFLPLCGKDLRRKR